MVSITPPAATGASWPKDRLHAASNLGVDHLAGGGIDQQSCADIVVDEGVSKRSSIGGELGGEPRAITQSDALHQHDRPRLYCPHCRALDLLISLIPRRYGTQRWLGK